MTFEDFWTLYRGRKKNLKAFCYEVIGACWISQRSSWGSMGNGLCQNKSREEVTGRLGLIPIRSNDELRRGDGIRLGCGARENGEHPR
jgi:hypothetical protein